MSQRPISSQLAILQKGDPAKIKHADENGEVKIVDFHMQFDHDEVRSVF
jgi:hypothetical protein